jgi:hypothetical protein
VHESISQFGEATEPAGQPSEAIEVNH